jgi:hypothetical protein
MFYKRLVLKCVDMELVREDIDTICGECVFLELDADMNIQLAWNCRKTQADVLFHVLRETYFFT